MRLRNAGATSRRKQTHIIAMARRSIPSVVQTFSRVFVTGWPKNFTMRAISTSIEQVIRCRRDSAGRK
ncbi:hypothetical protein ACGRH2_13935 [Vibrio barjaei]|uniref:Uncharacterized protein n=1 Tax=Vibrio barjaei TaxID=1676683 RepID=A0ABW7IJA8_9VIBR